MGNNPSYHRLDPNLPVEKVSWDDLHVEGGFLERTGFLLPTEAQWEYGCRGGTSGPYAGTGDLDDMGWHEANSGGQTHPVGLKQPNQFGLHDTHGNVIEWCENAYNTNFYSRPGTGGLDPASTVHAVNWVLRGGSCINDAQGCRSARRLGIDSSKSFFTLGFRPVVPAP